jgi:hypothetical protein
LVAYLWPESERPSAESTHEVWDILRNDSSTLQ